MSSRRRLDIRQHHERSHEQNVEHTAQLTSLNTAQTATNSKLDTLSGAINNNIGDGSVKLQTYVYGHDSGNGLARPLAVTANGELKVSNDVLEVSAETVNLNTDTLEAKTQAITDKLDTFAGAGNNNVGEGSSKLQTYLYGRDVGNGLFRPLVCDSDAHLQVDVLSTALPTGGATEATLAAAEVHLGSIDTTTTAMDIAVGGLRSDLTENGLGGGKKPGVMLESQNANLIAISNKMVGGQTTSGMATAANQQVVDLTLQGIDTILGNVETDISAIKTDAAALETLQTATNTKLDTLETTANAIQTAVEIIDNCISGSEAQVDVVTLPALPTGSNTIGTVNLSASDNAVLDAIATDGDNIQTKLDTLETTLTAIETDQAALEVLHTATNSLLTTLDGVQDNALTKLTNIETAVQLIDDVVKAEDAAHSGADKGIMGLSVRKDTATNLAGSDSDYQPLITDANGRLHGINKTAVANSSETSYVSGQAISGSGTFTGSAIAVDPNTKAFFLEHNFSNSAISYVLQASLDGTNFFDTAQTFNSVGASVTGINMTAGVGSSVAGFTPHIRFKFTDTSGSSQNITLSYVQQIG